MSFDYKSEYEKACATPVEELAQLFRAQGFVDADKEKDLGKELAEKSLKYMPYLTRVYQGQHQLLSLVGYQGLFVEAVFHVYAEPYNSRAKPPQVTLCGRLMRTVPEIQEAMDKVYELPKKEKKA